MAEVSVNLREIFAAAIEFESPFEREQYLDDACADNPRLRQEVEELLQAHVAAGSFLNEVTEIHALTEQPGDRIGPYKLLQQIGEGGMGVVYMAEQTEPVERRVALKIIKPGMDSQQVIARFQAERQALAMMDHPNIARVLDAGTTESGRPYFVMELVHGIPLTKYCDERRLTLRQRLELFVPVCQAIQHAHQKGVIHRDIKPSNILVTMYDDKAVPKVIDFGVAKAIEQRLTEKTLFTQYGTLVGTFEYMSPEQAEMNAFGVDTRSDIYSLGVLLYELLTGSTPIERSRLRQAAFMELVRLIKEEEPPRPSVRLSTSGGLPKFAAACRTEANQLPGMIRGDLDWIVMKCLEKDRTLRYETVNGLARDVERYLHDEPVEACPPSALYRLRKLARKHRGLLATATAFVTLLVVSSIVSTSFAFWAMNAQRRSDELLVEKDGLLEANQAALATAQTERQVAEQLRQKAEWDSRRLSTATETANEGIELYYADNLAPALAKFEEAAEVERDLYTIYLYRRKLYTDIGLWDLAAEDYNHSFRLMKRNQAHTCYEHALLEFYIKNDSGYREACQEFLRQYWSSDNAGVNRLLLRACCLSSQPVMDTNALQRRAETLASASSKPWDRATAALAFLRAGDPHQAIEICNKILIPGASSPNGVHRMFYVIQAMALDASGRTEEARDALSQLEAALDEWTQEMVNGPVGTMPIDWWDWVETLVLYREAKTQISDSPFVEDPRLVTLRERAQELAEGDVHTYMQLAREAMKQGEWDETAANYSTAIDKMLLSIRSGPGLSRYFIEMVQQPEVFERLVKLQPECFGLWWNRGLMNARRLDWVRASDDLVKTQEMIGDWATRRPGGRLAEDLAAVYLLAGHETDYLAMRDHIVSNEDRMHDPWSANSYSRACSLRPSTEPVSSCSLRLAEQAHAQNPDLSYHLYALGAAHYRAGHYEEATKPLQESLKRYPNWGGRALNHALLAMAYHKLGRTGEARASLNRARTAQERLEQFLSKENFNGAGSIFINDWLAMQVLIPEAEKLLSESDFE